MLFFSFWLLLFFIIITYLIYKYISFNWLKNTLYLTVLALPFERIPSIDIFSVTFRLSYLLTIISIYFLFILVFKKDKFLQQYKISLTSFWVVIFIVTSSLNWWQNFADYNRFIITFVATIIVFLAFWLIANFGPNINKIYSPLLLVFIIISIFGLYQFFGDLIGLPYNLTGLYFGYSKEVFGIPRVISTTLEPLYLANILIFPIIFTIIATIYKKSLFFKLNYNFNYLFLFLFSLVFILTFSKSAYLFVVIFGLLSLFIVSFLAKNMRVIKTLFIIGIITTVLAIPIILSSQKLQNSLNNIYTNFTGSINQTSNSAEERNMFTSTANYLLKDNILTGLGSGQFGFYGNKILANNLIIREDSYLIVNNVYLETWLENGFLSLLVFIFGLFYPLNEIILNFKKLAYIKIDLNEQKDNLVINKIFNLSLLFSLPAIYLQWFYFSPIYIMPIFILLALSYRNLKI